MKTMPVLDKKTHRILAKATTATHSPGNRGDDSPQHQNSRRLRMMMMGMSGGGSGDSRSSKDGACFVPEEGTVGALALEALIPPFTEVPPTREIIREQVEGNPDVFTVDYNAIFASNGAISLRLISDSQPNSRRTLQDVRSVGGVSSVTCSFSRTNAGIA